MLNRCDVVVHGLGLAGRRVFAALAEARVDVVGFDPRAGWVRPGAAGSPALWQPESLPLRLPCHLELPSRFLGAMGRVGVELLAAIAEYPGNGVPAAVAWVEPNAGPELEACVALGVRARPIVEGFELLDGSVEADADVLVRPGEPCEGEITIYATGLSGERWLADKVMAVRWQWIHVGTGAPRISRAGTVFSVGGKLCGARWATPHMEVGETDPTPSPVVTAMLERLAAQDGVARAAAPGAEQAARVRAGIVSESCDGLPIVGPIPGRPREAVVTGFGIGGRTYLPLAVKHLVASVLGVPGPALPSCLGTARFR